MLPHLRAFVLAALALPHPASAATYTWCGPASGSFEAPANWNSGAGCGMSGIPGPGDDVAISNASVSSTSDLAASPLGWLQLSTAMLSLTVAGRSLSCAGISVSAGSTSTLAVSGTGGIHVSGTVSVAATRSLLVRLGSGQFDGADTSVHGTMNVTSTAAATFLLSKTLTGTGVFAFHNAVSAQMPAAAMGSLTLFGGSSLTFTGSGGYLGGPIANANTTVTLRPVTGTAIFGGSFNNLVLDHSSGGDLRWTGGTLVVTGNLSQTGGGGLRNFHGNNGTLNFSGPSFSLGADLFSNLAALTFTGMATQVLDPGSNSATAFQSFCVSKTAGSLALQGNDLSVTGGFTLNGAASAFDLGGRTLGFSGVSLNANASVLSGSGKVLFLGGGAQALLPGSNPATVFPEVVVSKTGGSLAIGGPIKVSGDFTLIGASSTVSAGGFDFSGASFSAGDSRFNVAVATTTAFTGGLTQTVDMGSHPLTALNYHATVSKSGGSLTLVNHGLRLVNGNFSLIGAATNFNLGGQTLDVFNGGVFLNAGQLTGPGTLRFSGGGNVSLNSGTHPSTSFQHILVSKTAGTVSVGQDLTVTGNLSLQGGALDLASRTLRLAGDLANATGLSIGAGTLLLNGGDQAIYGANIFDTLSKTVASNATLTLDSGLTQTVTGLLSLNALPGQTLFLRASGAPARAPLNSTGARSLSYLDVKDSLAVTAINVIGQSCVDSGNNLSWTFYTPTSTPTPTATVTPSSTITPSVTPSSTATATPSTTPTPSATPSSTQTLTWSATASPSASASPTSSATGTMPDTATPSATGTPTPTPSGTATPTGTETLTTTPSGTATPVQSPTQTATAAPPATAVPTERAPGLAGDALAPVPARRGDAVCLHTRRLPSACTWDVYNVAGERVSHAEGSGPASQCLSTRGLAAGFYVARVDLRYPDGGPEIILRKFAVIP